MAAWYHLWVYEAEFSLTYVIDIIYTTVYNLKPHLISNPGRTQGLVDESLPGPQVLPPSHHHHSRAAGWIITPGHRFLWRSIKLHGNNENIWHISDTLKCFICKWNRPFHLYCCSRQRPNRIRKSLDKFKMEIYLLLHFVQQKYYTTFTFNPLRRLSTLLTLSEGAVAAPQIAHRSSLHKNLIKFN